jgi:hypothetical protein
LYKQDVTGNCLPEEITTKRLLIMKLAIRIFALSIAFAGVAAASVSSSTAKPFASHQSATATEPIPLCAPGLPTCPPPIDTPPK